MSASATPQATELRVDVSAAADTGERLTMAATELLPDALADAPHEPRTVLVGFPGGGYNRGYHDLDIPGHDGYSQARYHLARACAAAMAGIIRCARGSTSAERPGPLNGLPRSAAPWRRSYRGSRPARPVPGHGL